MVGFDNAALGKVIPRQSRARIRPVKQLRQTSNAFRGYKFPRPVFILHLNQKGVAVLDAAPQLHLAVMVRSAGIEAVPRLGSARQHLLHVGMEFVVAQEETAGGVRWTGQEGSRQGRRIRLPRNHG